MTTHDTELAEIEALPNHRARVEHAVHQLGEHPDTVTTEAVQDWFAERGYKLGDKKKQRSAVSGHLNAWRKELREKFGLDTAAIRALTPGTLAAMDAEHGFVGTPQETTPAGVEGSYNLDGLTVDSFEPSPNAPQSPAVSAPRPVAPRQPMTSLPPVMSAPRVAPSEPDASETPSPAPVSRDTDASVSVAPAAPEVAASDTDASGTPTGMTPNPVTRSTSKRGRAWNWLSGKFIWIQYVGLLQVAAYGLFQVLDEVAGAPLPTAIGGAVAVELIGITLKMYADIAERDGENYKVVRRLLIASGVVAFGIGATNGWGHSQMDAEVGENVYVAAALYGLASIAGYSLWTLRTALAHRARLRRLGQLEGPGIKVPAYARERYGDEVADRAELLSRYTPDQTMKWYIDVARIEVEEEAREARETARRNALRAALVEHSKASHNTQLAADLENARFSDDELSDMFTASKEEHAAKRAELLAWMEADKK